MDQAALVLTDSGGIQEETTVLGVPCLTLRWNTERPITCTMGTNTLIGTDPAAIREHGLAALKSGRPADPQVPPLWDGRAGDRIADIIVG
jgi:UDP-N-acetylglucosamine 2-epimerase (non-hydrolysing)